MQTGVVEDLCTRIYLYFTIFSFRFFLSFVFYASLPRTILLFFFFFLYFFWWSCSPSSIITEFLAKLHLKMPSLHHLQRQDTRWPSSATYFIVCGLCIACRPVPLLACRRNCVAWRRLCRCTNRQLGLASSLDPLESLPLWSRFFSR